MPISKKTINKWAKMLCVDPTKLKEAEDSDTEIEVETPEVKVFTTDGLKKLESEKYDAGKTAGLEMEIKAFKKENNLDFEGKDLKALTAHIESKTDADGRIKKLQENLTAAEKKAQEAETKAQRIEMQTAIYDAIPAEYNGYTKKELLALATANGFDFKAEKGKILPLRNGDPVRVENTQADVPLSEALKNFFETEKGMKPAGAGTSEADRKGRGSDSTKVKEQTTAQKRSEIEKAWLDANPGMSVNGQDYASHFATQVKEAKAAGVEVVMD